LKKLMARGCKADLQNKNPVLKRLETAVQRVIAWSGELAGVTAVTASTPPARNRRTVMPIT